ncbi:hypothetical protein [Pseudoalteromonas sp. UG3-2]|uniref:hypothetical protein n=1 Tax=Pseudoalteromonas sp. UG3-2 TaxID=3079885 RepID=UPI0030152EEA
MGLSSSIIAIAQGSDVRALVFLILNLLIRNFMTPTDFGLGVLASYFANTIDKVIKLNGNDESPEPQLKEDTEVHKARKFRTFDARYGIPSALDDIEKPLVSILIERNPSTHYNLPCVVIESRANGEWYVMSKGNISFQGSGGGLSHAKSFISKLKEKNADIGVWVYDNSLVDDLSNGYTLWPEIKGKGIPLRSFIEDDASWKEIVEKATAMSY